MGIMRWFNRDEPAVTDVFDTHNGLLGVKYPAILVSLLGIAGVLAFGLTGFLGYPDDPDFSRRLFHQPWPLILWVWAILYTYQISVYRHKSQRGRLISMLTATTLSIVAIGIGYFKSDAVKAFLNYILTQLGLPLLQNLKLDNAIFWTALEVLILGIFWLDTLRRWVRRARGLPPYPNMDELPDLSDLIAGDLIASGVLTIILAIFFWEPVTGAFVHLIDQTAHVTTCTVALPGACRDTAVPPNTLTLTFINTILTLFTLSIGMVVLALSSVLAGLGAVEGVDEQVGAATQHLGSATADIGAGVSSRVINTLWVALGRRLQLALASLVLSLRVVLWPALVFISCLALALGSREVQHYLHNDKTLPFVIAFLLPAIGWFIIAVATAVMAPALQSVSFRVLWNSLSFLGLIGFVLLLTFWLFSIAMWSLAELLRETYATTRDPFGLGLTTLLSAAALGAYAILAYAPRLGRRRAPAGPVEAAG